jgi:hypothetical protein
MKTKKFNKILVLNKKTVVNLDIDQMKGIYGGESTPMSLCLTYCWPNNNCISNTICQEDCPGA